jgi:hypothetical protein
MNFKHITVDQLSKILYQVDPLNIAYSVTEYDDFAEYSLNIECVGLNIIDSINESLKFLDGRGKVLSEENTRKILNKIAKIIKKNVKDTNIT